MKRPAGKVEPQPVEPKIPRVGRPYPGLTVWEDRRNFQWENDVAEARFEWEAGRDFNSARGGGDDGTEPWWVAMESGLKERGWRKVKTSDGLRWRFAEGWKKE